MTSDRSRAPPAAQNANVRAILDAAREVFLSRGYGASLDEVGVAAGVTRRTLYNNFDNKEDLFRAMLIDVSAALNAHAGLKLGDGPIVDELLTFAIAYRTLILRSESLALLRVMSENGMFPDLPPKFYEDGLAPTIDVLEPYLERLIAAGTLKPLNARFLAEQFLSLVLGQSRTRALLRMPADSVAERDAYLRQVVELFLGGAKA